ncbi:MAG: SpoIIE family protein phosphatase [Ferruginibacter sp.]|nr:SpoIIE family protein phosphatase [Cytophagales bacterium]
MPVLLLFGITQPVRASGTEGRPAHKPHLQLTLYKDSVRLAESGKTPREASHYLTRLGSLYLSLKRNQEGIAYFNQWLKANPGRLQTTMAAATYLALGNLYPSTTARKSIALEAFGKAVRIYRTRKDHRGLADALLHEGKALERTKQTAQAVVRFDEALSLAKKAKDQPLQRVLYGRLAEAHGDLGKYKQSMEAMARYTELDEKIRAGELRAKEIAMQHRTDEMRGQQLESQLLAEEMEERSVMAESQVLEKEKDLRSTKRTLRESQRITRERQLEIENLRKADQIKELTLRKQEATIRFERYVRNSLIALGGLGLVFLGIVYWSYRQKRKANVLLTRQKAEIQQQHDEIEQQSIALREAIHEIEKKTQNITSSIVYAQRIQQSILPDWQEIKHYFADSFLLYRPRDIVSGDFFWFARRDGKAIIVAVDCTGHGVPGAFISMAGHTWLNHIVNERGVTQADEILNHLHRELRQALRQATSENRDGMDLALVVVDERARTLEFAGAKNPMVIIRNGELQIVKGDRHAVGGHQHEEERRFTRHVFDLVPRTHFYLFSDGFQDQFGGEDNQKFMAKRLHRLLHERHHDPMVEQAAALEQTLDGWMNGHRQIDDILMMGFRV